MKVKRLLALMLVVAMATAMLAGCGKKASYPGTEGEGEITVNLGTEPPEMFTVTTQDSTSFTVIRHVIENMVMLDENDRIIEGVAYDWDVSEDGLVYNFKLREGMKWSNGEPVTANDFVFAWTSLLSPDFAAPYASFGYVFKNGEAFNNGEATAEDLGFKVISDYELEVTLERPTTYFLDMLAFGVFAPLNEKAYNEFGEAYGTDADKMAYNGAFTMTSWEHENKIVLEKNPEYWNADAIEVNKITMAMIKDANAAMNSFKAGDIDVIGLNGEQLEMMKKEEYPTRFYDDGGSWYFEFNNSNQFLQNENLRKAITYAVDKQAFVDAILKNASKAATSYTPAAITNYDPLFCEQVGDIIPIFDKDEAKKLYDQALEELSVDKIELSMIADDTDQAIDIGAFIQEQLKTNLGIELKVENMPFKSRIERMNTRDFDIVLAGWGPDYNDPMTFIDLFESTNGNNHAGYNNPEYDALLDEIRAEADPEARKELLIQAEKMLLEDMPIGPIYWRSRDYVTSEKIESGVIRTAFQDMNYRYVKLAKTESK